MKIDCKKRNISDTKARRNIPVFVDENAQKLYFGEAAAEVQPLGKIVFQPEKRDGPTDFEHERFVNCLMRLAAEGHLTKDDMRRLIHRGRPVWKTTRIVEPEPKPVKKTRPTVDVEKIIATMTELHKQMGLFEDEKNQFPINTEKAEKSSVQDTEANEESPVQTEEDDEIYMQQEDAAYVGSVNDSVFRVSVNNTTA
jgi:hypothetical protein